MSAPKEPVEFVNPMALSAAFRFRKTCNSPRPQTPPFVLVDEVIRQERFHALAVFVSGIFLGNVRGPGQPEDAFEIDVPVQHEPVVVRVATLPLNPAILVRRGQMALLNTPYLRTSLAGVPATTTRSHSHRNPLPRCR